MPRKRDQRSAIAFHVDKETSERARALAAKKAITKAELGRIALLHYLGQDFTQESLRAEAGYIVEFKKSTNRICALLAKSAIDTNTIARYIWESGDDQAQELFRQCYEKAIKRISQRATPKESEIVSRLTE